LKSDWRAIGTDPPDTVKEEEYNESFANFDGDSPLTVTFEHTVEIITAEDYTQTQRFEVSVNANIPVSLVVMVGGDSC
jgi:hypothetical protein